jgi:RimJ/RimL family protein N-acetyltransferase
MIVFNNTEFGHAIATAAGTHFNPAVDVSIGRVNKNGNLLGGVIYSGYTGASIGIHVAAFSDYWINKDMLWVTFHYPFVRLGCHKIFGQVPSYKTKTLEFDKKLGFIEEARIKDFFPDGDLIVLSMKREDCRWLSIKPQNLKEPV